MGGVEDCHWVDTIIDEIGFALTKADETIQKSIELWTELTKDMFDHQPTQELTRQPNNGISDEEHSSEDKSVAEGSSLRWKGGYELLKNVETSSEEDDESWDDEVEDCYSESVENAMEMLWKYTMRDTITESLVGHDGGDDVSDKLQGFIDVRQEEIAIDSEVETVLPDCDWVYVTTD